MFALTSVSPTITLQASTIGTISSANASTSSTALLLANSSRKGATFFYTGSSTMYLGLCNGPVDTVSNYTIAIPGGGYYELPINYQGPIYAIWAAQNGTVQVTELT